MTRFQWQYKCRRCGAIFDGPVSSPNNETNVRMGHRDHEPHERCYLSSFTEADLLVAHGVGIGEICGHRVIEEPDEE